jgi:DNA-binding Lrp family transcriptional regulator
MQAMADARVARQNEINKAIAKRKARIKELKEAGVIILIAVIIVPVAIFALLYTIIN